MADIEQKEAGSESWTEDDVYETGKWTLEDNLAYGIVQPALLRRGVLHWEVGERQASESSPLLRPAAQRRDRRSGRSTHCTTPSTGSSTSSADALAAPANRSTHLRIGGREWVLGEDERRTQGDGDRTRSRGRQVERFDRTRRGQHRTSRRSLRTGPHTPASSRRTESRRAEDPASTR